MKLQHHCSRYVGSLHLAIYCFSVLVVVGTVFVPGAAAAAQVPAFFYTVKTGSSSDYIPDYDITLSSDRYSFIRDFPTENVIDEIDWVSSPSFAKNYIVAYATGGKLYQLRGWDSGSLSFKEFDPVTLVPLDSGTTISGADLLSYTSVYSAFMNPGIIYWFNWETDPFDNDSGMESYVIATGARTFLANNCTEYSAGEGELYCINVTDDSGTNDFNGRNLEISKLDAISGVVTESLGSWSFPVAVSPGRWYFANANSMLYMARMNGGNTELRVFDTNAYISNPVSTNAPVYITGWAAPLGADGLPTDFSDLRVSGDKVMIYHVVGKTAVIYDTVTGTTDNFITAIQGQSRMHFMMQEAPAAPSEDPTTTTEPVTDTGSTAGSSGSGAFHPILLLLLCLTGLFRIRNIYLLSRRLVIY